MVWFNGPSVRQFLDIPRQPLEIGCNFIEQHRSVDHVCAYDRQCVALIEPQEGVQYWTRRACERDHFRYHRSDINYYDSGTLALNVAMNLIRTPVYVLGCDWGESNGSIYDEQYTWRDHQPGKQTNAKMKLIEQINRRVQLIFVHERSKGYFGNDVAWMTPERFLQLTV